MTMTGTRIQRLAIGALIAAAGIAGAATQGTAESVADFYKGKTINMIIGIPPGGGYDSYARVVARHMGKHIPGHPKFVPQNMPGGAEMNAANYVVNVAPQDGTAIAATTRTVPFLPLYGTKAAKFDPLTINWLGSSNQDVGLFVLWRAAGDFTLDDMFKKQVIVGVNTPGSDTVTYANILKYMFGAKLKVVSGYPGSKDILLAMQRGEVQAIPNYSWSSLQRHASWLKTKKVRILLQIGLKKLPDLPDVPLISELARTDEQRSVLDLMLAQTTFGRPYFLGPGVPADRMKALRAAFMATMKDPAFLADAKKQRLMINPVSGEEMQEGITRIYKLPHALVEKAKELRLK